MLRLRVQLPEFSNGFNIQQLILNFKMTSKPFSILLLFFVTVYILFANGIMLAQDSEFSSIDFDETVKTLNRVIQNHQPKLSTGITYPFNITPTTVTHKFDSDSYILTQIHRRMESNLVKKFVPDIQFLSKNTRYYRIEEISTNTGKKYIIDTSFTLFQFSDLKFLVICNVSEGRNPGTIIFISNADANKKLTSNPEEVLSEEVLNLYPKKQQNDAKGLSPRDRIESLNIIRNPAFICFTGPRFLPSEVSPALVTSPHEWFEHVDSADASNKESRQLREKGIAIFNERKKLCEELVKTESGRAKLIELVMPNENESELKNSIYISYRDYCELFKNTISRYYSNKRMQEGLSRGGLPISLEEEKAIRKLLKSDDVDIQFFGVILVQTLAYKALVPDLLNICLNKRYNHKRKHSCAVFSKGEDIIIEYSNRVILVIGELGDERTLRSLRSTLQSADEDFKTDIKQAIEHIESNIVERERRRQNWFNTRREIREGKRAIISETINIDIDKPDPEPVSPEGYRNWETKDGLFKTMAKFVGLQDNAAIKGKDVKLLRKDGKEVAIELSALRSTDSEYIRQLLAPERNWTRTDDNTKLKAKLFAKFDDEIIVQESDGINTRIKIEALSETDKEYLKQIPLSPHSKNAFW
ncbi:MAG: hypothetical protein LBL62_10095 [Planctomycetaceae bacterium]|jgi:hypothetical protein|nr:hypothetical protein [Planctomycetaceae bacterium]